MQTLLYRWSTTLQVVSDLMIALFFIVLTRTMGRPELRSWRNAWLANVAALSVTVAFWVGQPASALLQGAMFGSYAFFKVTFILLLIVGALGFTRHAVGPAMLRNLLGGALLYGMLIGALSLPVVGLGMVQSTLNGVLFLAGAALVVRTAPAGYAWLATGFALRGAFAATEALVYGSRYCSVPWAASPQVEAYLASHSSFDAAAEWMISLGCVLMMYRVILDELDVARTRLQDQAERDALTGLSNRRSLLPIMQHAAASGATVLFFDLNDFKGINDTLGHQVGDACLKRFGEVLLASFRPSDHVIRYAGDEFIVVARGVRPEGVSARIDAARERLRQPDGATPPIRFSVGMAYLDVNGEPEQVLREADAAMYRDKPVQ